MVGYLPVPTRRRELKDLPAMEKGARPGSVESVVVVVVMGDSTPKTFGLLG
tara:strand:- start:204633 stop:204785 length:153 start_codon:yes stop_codon:yes gene_type:complete